MIDMNEMMKKAQELSETMKQQQEELAKTDYFCFCWWRDGEDDFQWKAGSNKH